MPLSFSGAFSPRPPVCSFPAPRPGEGSALRDVQSGSKGRGLPGAATSRPRGSHNLRHLLHVRETGTLGHPESVPGSGGRGRSQRGWPALGGDAAGHEATPGSRSAVTLLPTLGDTPPHSCPDPAPSLRGPPCASLEGPMLALSFIYFFEKDCIYSFEREKARESTNRGRGRSRPPHLSENSPSQCRGSIPGP